MAYVRRCFSEYFSYGGLTREALAGRRVLEVGPGDNLGVALLFAAAGASKVVAADRFQYDQDSPLQQGIYKALRETLDAADRTRFDRAVDLSGGVAFAADVLEPVAGAGAGELAGHFPAGSFDLAVSRAVIQEIRDIRSVFTGIDFVLAPGGRHLHKIDLRDYGVFSRHGHHPLTYLTFSESLYNLMGDYPGRLNRVSIAGYRDILAELGHQATLLVTQVIGWGYPGVDLPVPKETLAEGIDFTGEHLRMVEEIRPRLVESHRDLSVEDLIASGVFISAVKPGRPG